MAAEAGIGCTSNMLYCLEPQIVDAVKLYQVYQSKVTKISVARKTAEMCHTLNA